MSHRMTDDMQNQPRRMLRRTMIREMTQPMFQLGRQIVRSREHDVIYAAGMQLN
jgi:hypothetical protein